MATPTPTRYSVPHGATCYGGKSGPAGSLPAWVPAPGTFAEIGLNTVNDVRPAGWPAGDTISPFGVWGGGALLPDFSAQGGIGYHGGGHPASSTNSLWTGVIMLDLSTRLISMRNTAAAPLIADTTQYNAFGESTVSTTLGHTWGPHTYAGLVNRPAAYGGGAKGSLMRVNLTTGTGAFPNTPVHQFDVSSATAPPARKVDSTVGGEYPIAVYDSIRHGFWYMVKYGGTLYYYAYNVDGSIADPVSYDTTLHTGGDGNMVYIPERDCLVAIMRMDQSDLTKVGVFVNPIVNNVPQGWTQVAPTGAGPNDSRCGGSWCAPLNSIICYQANGSTTVHKLTPPAGSLTGSGWTWTTETMTAVGGISPSNNGQGAGAWGRMIYVPNLRCCIWLDSVFSKPQAWRLTGM